jgi:hypothetical protein
MAIRTIYDTDQWYYDPTTCWSYGPMRVAKEKRYQFTSAADVKWKVESNYPIQVWNNEANTWTDKDIGLD